MKMGAGLFWGIVLITIGLSIILRIMFDVNVVRVVIAVFFILIGIKILLGKPMTHHHQNESENTLFMGERHYQNIPKDRTEYNTIFGKTVYDYRNITNLEELHTRIQFHTVFGSTDILLPANIPVRIKTDAVFSAIMLPNGNSVSFGSANYNSGADADSSQLLDIEAHVVFGSLNIKQ